MDINYHYFAVKTIALQAGFNDQEAQRIASYSQFIDDYNRWAPYYFQQIPDFMRNTNVIVPEKGGYFQLNVTTTGFDSMLDMADLIRERSQQDITVPFHFIPFKPLAEIDLNHESRNSYITRPATIEGYSLIGMMLQRARRDYSFNEETDPFLTQWNLLMKIGMLFHIFADTYAHQNFSGLQGAENHCKLVEMRHALDGSDMMDEEYSAAVFRMASIGHVNAGHAPDKTYVSFRISRPRNEEEIRTLNYTDSYGRSNFSEFLKCSHEIFSYLYQLKHGGERPTNKDYTVLDMKLRIGFKARGPVAELAKVWSEAVKASFDYSKASLWDNLLSGGSYLPLSNSYVTAHDDFFLYNLYARQIHDIVHFGFRA